MRQEFRILIDVVFNVQSQELYRTIDLSGEELQLPYDHVMFAEEQVCGEGATGSSDSDEQTGSMHLQSGRLKEHN